jgi:hypothetical protein
MNEHDGPGYDAALCGNIVNSVYAPGASGFNLADVASKSEVDSLTAGEKGLGAISHDRCATPARVFTTADRNK